MLTYLSAMQGVWVVWVRRFDGDTLVLEGGGEVTFSV